MNPEDSTYMAEALRLAELGRYISHPNPAVGCVLVRQGKIVGRGHTLAAGQDHAEAAALKDAGEAAAAATAYVTLEPCSFEGRTPSCAKALVAAGVSRVVVAMLDPDPRNNGKGLAVLEAAGIDVTKGVMEASAQEQLKGHVSRLQNSRPWVRLKLAMTLDGKTALANGDSKWITSDAARADVQRLRAVSGAIVTGVQTVIDDDPALNVRELGEAVAAVPRPVYVLDSAMRIPDTARLLQREGNVVVCKAGEARELAGTEVLELPAGQGGIDLSALLAELAKREHSEVLFECGAALAGSLVSQGLADELLFYVAPRLMGGSARSLLNLPEIDRMSALIDLQITDIRKVGDDFRITARPG